MYFRACILTGYNYTVIKQRWTTTYIAKTLQTMICLFWFIFFFPVFVISVVDGEVPCSLWSNILSIYYRPNDSASGCCLLVCVFLFVVLLFSFVPHLFIYLRGCWGTRQVPLPSRN